jgi:hypothetical protein
MKIDYTSDRKEIISLRDYTHLSLEARHKLHGSAMLDNKCKASVYSFLFTAAIMEIEHLLQTNALDTLRD